MLAICFDAKPRPYTGAELRSHWIRQTFGLVNDAAVAFCGPADVREHLVDLADRERQAFIYSPLMLHFLIEHFHMPLQEAVARQRLCMAIMRDLLPDLCGAPQRSGDDIYIDGRKLSVSIATASPVSALIHMGLNIDAQGAPVPAIGLNELKITASAFAETVLNQYQAEDESMRSAANKVLAVP